MAMARSVPSSFGEYDDSRRAGTQRITVTYIGGHCNGEQQMLAPGETPEAVIARRVELVRRGVENGHVTVLTEHYQTAEVAPGWWVAVHEVLKRGER